MSNLWSVVARRIYTTRDGWTGSEGIPTFILDGDIQGITTQEHAERVALAVLGAGKHASERFSIHVCKRED
jgi:hypothetical protein